MARYSFRKAMKRLGIGFLGAVGIGLGGGGAIPQMGGSAIAQNVIIPDNTLGAESSVVVPLTPAINGIRGGAVRGENLFHSFEQFDIGTATGVLFLLESNAVDNIFARVSTQNISEIAGLLGIRNISSGSFLPSFANLYLINPSGIVFSDNAVLDFGGSFTATTADNILFSDGSTFGKVVSIPLLSTLTVNPSAYLFSGQTAGNINVQTNLFGSNSFGIDQGLSVALRENLSLIGGNISINGLNAPLGAGLTARGGRINVVAVREGHVDNLLGGVLSPAQSNVNGNIALNNSAILETSLNDGGSILLSGQDIQINSSVIRTGILSGVGSQSSQAGNIVINAHTLSVGNGAQIDTSIRGTGNAGDVNINAQRVVLTGSRIEGANTSNPQETLSAIRSVVEATAIGMGGEIIITAPEVEISGGAGITASILGRGNAGNVLINANSFKLSGTSSINLQPSSIQNSSEMNAVGNGGNTTVIASREILIESGAGLAVAAFGQGSVGKIQLSSENIILRGTDRAGFPSTVDARAGGNAITSTVNSSGESPNAITITAISELRLEDGAQLNAGTSSSADSGNISIAAPTIRISGATTATTISGLSRSPSGVLATTDTGSRGRGGDITISARSLTIEEGGALTSRSLGEGMAGNIVINADNQIFVSNGDIDTISAQTSGGDVTIKTRVLRLEGDGDITTRAVEGRGGGGSIDITATGFIIALDDSDIIASAAQGRGGNISLRSPGFFGESFTTASLSADPDTLDRNGRVDINATGSVNGIVTVPDVSFLENGLTSLPDTLIAPEQLIANSCIARADDGQGTLVTTGGGLANSPNSNLAVPLSTGTVQAIPSSTESARGSEAENSIVEPTEIYQLADGRLVMNRECL